MFHHKILEKFKTIFPMWAQDVYEWKDAGKYVIKIKLTSLKEDLIFEYHADHNWCLHTIRFM